MMQDTSVSDLVRRDRVHRSVYTDPDIFELEMDRLWGRAWIYVGHASQIPNHGDFFTTTVARQPVILIRDQDAAINVFFNRCAHKGARVLEAVSGTARILRCGYHGWTYKTDGTNHAVSGGKEAYRGTEMVAECGRLNLQRVPRVGVYRDFIFAALDADAVDFDTWIGPVKASFDNMVDRSPEGALEVTGGVLRYVHDSNWKFFVENLNDMLHAMHTHQSSAQTARIVGKKQFGEQENWPAAIQILGPFAEGTDFYENMGIHAFDYGHSYSGGKVSIHSAYSEIPEYTDAMRKTHGEGRMNEIFSIQRHNTVVYPSMTLKGAIQTIRVVKPLTVDSTLIESYVLRLRGAPDELLQRSVLYSNLINSSANLVGPDDYEAYHRLQEGLASDGGDWVSMHRHLDADAPNDEGGHSATGSSDMVFRGQFEAWRRYMTEDRKVAA